MAESHVLIQNLSAGQYSMANFTDIGGGFSVDKSNVAQQAMLLRKCLITFCTSKFFLEHLLTGFRVFLLLFLNDKCVSV